MDKMKKGVSPLIAVVLLIVIGIGLVAIVVPMIREPTEKTMKEASETSERIFDCKNIDYEIMNPCKCIQGSDSAIWFGIENKKNNEIYNFIFQLVMNDNQIEVSEVWNCLKNGVLCSKECEGEETCPFLVNLNSYEKASVRTKIFSDEEINKVITLNVVPEIVINENKATCKDIIKKINIQSLTTCTPSVC